MRAYSVFRRRNRPSQQVAPSTRPKWGRRERRQAVELVSEAESFLRGQLADRLAISLQPVPVWAWANMLAHGDVLVLEAERAREVPKWDFVNAGWRQARSYLATEVLVCATHRRSLSDLQREVLVPLELELARDTQVGTWAPGDLARAIEKALGPSDAAFSPRGL